MAIGYRVQLDGMVGNVYGPSLYEAERETYVCHFCVIEELAESRLMGSSHVEDRLTDMDENGRYKRYDWVDPAFPENLIEDVRVLMTAHGVSFQASKDEGTWTKNMW